MAAQKPAEGRPGAVAVSPDRLRSLGNRGALVIGGNRLALGVVRSLGRRGIATWVLVDEQSIAAFSRYAARGLPWPYDDREAQCGFLLDLADRYRLDGWVLFPSGERETVLIAQNHDLLSRRYLLTTPPWEVTRWACDKRLAYELADRVGVALPWTRYPAGREELEALNCPFPVVLKPAQKVEGSYFARVKALRADDRRELLSQYDHACRMSEPGTVMVQELIPGDGEAQFSFAALCSGGQVIASLAARRARQWPVDFGVASSYVETIAGRAVEDAGTRLLRAMNYTGIAEIEFKFDRRIGKYKLLDVNPRVWGWHSIGPRAGVDFPYLLWRMVHGLPVEEVRGRTGVRWIRFGTDVLASYQLLRRGRLSVGAYLQSLLGNPEPALLAADDPMPPLIDLLAQSLALLRRRMDHSSRGLAGSS